MDLRPSPIAGRWYPAQADRLAQSVDRYLNNAQAPISQASVVGVIAPHAGHLYSGAVAGHAFKTVRGATYATVVVVCPSHFHDDGPVLTSGHAAYVTPLGQVIVDQDAVEQLRDALGPIGLIPIRHDQEHAIEIELPFLQRALENEFRLVPIMLRDQSMLVVEALGKALANVLAGKRALVVGSSDLSHFQPQLQANALDAEMLKSVAAFDPAGVIHTQESGRGFACGYGAIAAALWAARGLGATQAHVLMYATSGDVSGDYLSVVGYGAAVMWKE